MGMFFFYNARKPRQFDHKPIYWNPRKEALEERIQKIKRELGEADQDLENYKPSIRGTFVEGTKHLKKSKGRGDTISDRIYKNTRLILVLALLSVIFWFFFLK